MSLSDKHDTNIYMYFGNAAASLADTSAATWGNGYESVYHLHDNFADSSANQVAGTNNGSIDAPGLAGDGQTFDGSSYIDTNWISNSAASQDFTWSGWFRVTTVNSSDDLLGIEDILTDSSEIRLSVRDNDSNSVAGSFDIWIRPDTGTAYNGSVTPVPIADPNDGSWHYAVLQRDGSTGRLYYDGSQIDSAAVSTNALNFLDTLLIGAQWESNNLPNRRNYFTGDLDEIRTSAAVRSADWIATEFNNQSDPYAFYRILPEVQQADVELDLTETQITLEAWVKYNSAAADHLGILSKNGFADGYRLVVDDPSHPISFDVTASGGLGQVDTTGTITADPNWHHIVGTWDGTTMVVYIDGTADPSTDPRAGNVDRGGKEFWIGHGDHAIEQPWSFPWDGDLDEVRISDIERGADWVATQHNNQSSPATFHLVGAEEPNGNFCGPDETLSTITASPTSIAADGSSTSTITIQLVDSYGNNLTVGGDTVTIATNLGSLSGTVTDSGDGTYTETLTAAVTPGTATVTGTVNAAPITDNATVDFTGLAWVQCDYEYRKKITIYASQVTADQTNFPVLIHLDGDGELAANARNDSFDIVFTESNGLTKLNYEIELYDPGSGELVAWVNVTNVSSTVNTDIYMYFGNASASDQSNPTGVWDGNFKGVWHLNESVVDETIGGTHSDSTTLGNNGTQNNNGPVMLGQIAGAQDFDGTADEITVAGFTGISGYPVTISAWSAATGDNGSFRAAATVGTASDEYFGIGWSEVVGSTEQTEIAARDTSSFQDMGGTIVNEGDWTHIVGVYVSDTVRHLYVDGAFIGTDTNSVSVPTAFDKFQMGQILDNTNGFMQVDEVRISGSIRDADWIATEYNNQNSPSTFYTIGGVEAHDAFCTGATAGWWDCNYDYRQSVSVDTGTSAVPAGYTTSFTFDHAALVTGGKSLASGDDVRIVYWNGSWYDEVDRYLDPDSAWDSATTKVWFQTRSAVGASSSDTDYGLYYGYPSATSPAADPTRVFFFYDGHESGDLSAWDDTYTGLADTLTVVSGPSSVHRGTYSAEAFVDGGAVDNVARVENYFPQQTGFHATVWAYFPSGSLTTDDIPIQNFYAGGWGNKVAGISIQSGTFLPFITNFNPGPAEYYFSSTPVSFDTWQRFELKIEVGTGRAELWMDGVREVNETGKDFGGNDIDHVLKNIFFKSASTGPDTLYFDDSMDRMWIEPEPTVAFSAEENSTCSASPGQIYWTGTGTDFIQRSELDGTNIQNLVTTGLVGPYRIDLDSAGGKMYWADRQADKIQRANLDGTVVEDLVTGLSEPEFISLDVAAGKMYWTDSVAVKIQRANLDGTAVEDIVTGIGNVYGMALDLSAGKVYWVREGPSNLIQRANLDGSSVENVTPTSTDNPKDIELDVAAGKMYFVESGAVEQIRSANLDGSGPTVLVSGLGNVRGVALYTAGAADPATSTITAVPTSITGDGMSISTITVQLKDSAGTSLITGGETVTLATNLGSLGPVTDNGDGTYSAILTAPSGTGTATLTGTLNAVAITDNATVDFTAASCFANYGKTVHDIGVTDYANSIVVQPDGKIVVGGATNGDFLVIRFNADGTLDSTFDGDGMAINDFGTATNEIGAIALQSDGKIVAAGWSQNGTSDEFAVARYNTDGSLDTTFGGVGYVTTDFGLLADRASGVVVQSNGKIVVIGRMDNGPNDDFAIARYNTDGSLDITFSVDGMDSFDFNGGQDRARDVVVQSDGKIILVGQVGGGGTDFGLARYNTDGTLDNTFDGDGMARTDFFGFSDQAREVAIQSDSQIVVVGRVINVADEDFAVARYNTDGSLDTSFSGDGKAVTDINGDDQGEGPGLQADGKIVVVGYSNASVSGDYSVIRYSTGGSLDTSFDGDGIATTDVGGFHDDGEALAIQPDGKIVAVGHSMNATDDDASLVRYNPDGSLDNLGCAAFSGGSGKIYWIDDGTNKIQRANLDGSNVEDLIVAGLDRPRRLALDTIGGKMYWTDRSAGAATISRANLDGSNIEILISSGLTTPRGIALDLAAGKMYWTDTGTAKIQRANLDGSAVQDLVTAAGDPRGIALDVSGGKMYWTENTSNEIRRASLDGTGVETLVTGLDLPRGIELDVAAGKMYWTDLATFKIQRADMAVSVAEDLITTGLNEHTGITLDLSAGKIYWTDYFFDHIRRANLDGSNVQDVIPTGLTEPVGIEVHVGGVIVNNTGDGIDFNAGDGACETGAGNNVCTLRTAIEETNASASLDTIEFNIPTSDPGYQGAPNFEFVIQPGTPLPPITDPVSINGYSQPGAQVNAVASPGASDAVLLIEIDGTNSIIDGLTITAGSSTVKGLVINRFTQNALILSTGNGNLVEGNYLGTDVTGTVDRGSGRSGISIQTGSSNNTVGGTMPAARNLLSGNEWYGIVVSSAGTTGNQILGNYIGSDVDGTTGLGNTLSGVKLEVSSDSTTVGGAAARNIISDNQQYGVFIGASTGNIVQGNNIGTDVNGAALGNASNGVRINSTASNNTIGGTAAGAGNVIANNGGRGISVANTVGAGNAFLGNSIYNTTNLGIDLRDGTEDAFGVTQNDAGDGDIGPNDLMNFPVIYVASLSGGNITVTGEARPGATVKFFEADGDASGHGEGQTFIASKVEGSGDDSNGGAGTTDATANQFTFIFAQGSIVGGDEITATATDAGNSTSEFSLNVTVTVPATLYRSVGTNSGNLNTAPETVEIIGTTATFSGAMPDNIGVGDSLSYNNGSDQLAFITGRSSFTVYTIANKDGGAPAATAAGTAVGVYRAYTSLFNWEASTENANIMEPVENDV